MERCRILRLLLAAGMLICSRSQGQRIDTTEIGSNRYFFSDTTPYSPRLNWFLAYQYCRNIGMDLLSMPRQEEAQELFQFLQKNGKFQNSYWMSGNQLGSPMWIWMTTGQPLNGTFDFWDQGGPPLAKSENGCMSVRGGRWSPSSCMEDKAFMCQLTRCFYFNYAVSNTRPSAPQGVRSSNPPTPSKSATPPTPATHTVIRQRDRKLPLVRTRRPAIFQPSLRNPPNTLQKLTKPQPQPTSSSNGRPISRAFHQFHPAPPHPLRELDKTRPPFFSKGDPTTQNEILPESPLPLELVPPSLGSERDFTRVNTDAAGSFRQLGRKEEFSWAFSRAR